jgi:hypothetical protein
MYIELQLNIFLALFLIISSIDGFFLPHLDRKELNSIKLNNYQGIALLVCFIVVAAFMVKFMSFISRSNLVVLFSFLVIVHSIWLMTKKKIIIKSAVAASTFLLIACNFLFQSFFLHNLLIIFAISWLGYFLKELKLLNLKQLIAVSIIGMVYDFIYVHVTQTATSLNNAVEVVHFPLGIFVKFSVIGTADLLFSAVILSFLPTVRSKIVVSCLFVLSNILLTYFVVTTTSIKFFPLLLIWGPVGIVSLLISRKQSFSMKV